MAQKMCETFIAEPELFNDLPPEVWFVETVPGIAVEAEVSLSFSHAHKDIVSNKQWQWRCQRD